MSQKDHIPTDLKGPDNKKQTTYSESAQEETKMHDLSYDEIKDREKEIIGMGFPGLLIGFAAIVSMWFATGLLGTMFLNYLQ